MITIVYRIIVALVLLFTLINMFQAEKIKTQANAAMVVIPLVLRMLMIK